MLRTEDVEAGYGKIMIIQGVSMELRDKEIIAIVGPNGSGKSTLIKAIFGLANVFSGRIFFGQKDIGSMEPEEKASLGLGYVPQVDNIFLNLKVEENLEMGAFLRKSKDEIRSDMKVIYEMFPILHERRRLQASTLSGGEKQMLAIARALMARPSVLLLDEPTAALAPKVVNEIFKKIDEIRRGGVSIALVEQHARKALEFVDRGYVLVAGRKVLEGAGKEVLANEEMIKAYIGRK